MKLSVWAMIIAALFAAPAAAQQPRATSEQAIAAIRKLGGEVTVAEQPGQPVSVVLTGSPKAAECLPHLSEVKNLQTCDL